MKFADTRHGKFYYFNSDDIGRRIAAGEFFDEHLKPYMDRLSDGDTLVDIGANIGFFTVYAALFRKAQVYAFEASGPVFDLLEKNVEANGLQESVHLKMRALYDRRLWLKLNPAWRECPVLPDGTLDYENCPNSGGLSLVPGADEGIFSAVPLDDFSFEKVNLIKVDTQGADLRVLVGGRKTIDRFRPPVIFEFEDAGGGRNASGDSMAGFISFFSELGYQVKEIAGTDCIAEPI